MSYQLWPRAASGFCFIQTCAADPGSSRCTYESVVGASAVSSDSPSTKESQRTTMSRNGIISKILMQLPVPTDRVLRKEMKFIMT